MLHPFCMVINFWLHLIYSLWNLSSSYWSSQNKLPPETRLHCCGISYGNPASRCPSARDQALPGLAFCTPPEILSQENTRASSREHRLTGMLCSQGPTTPASLSDRACQVPHVLPNKSWGESPNQLHGRNLDRACSKPRWLLVALQACKAELL